MGAVEDAVDAAANFIGPFVAKTGGTSKSRGNVLDATKLVDEALSHLQAINQADLAADPDAPYDASLAGVVYGILDLITSLGILPCLSPGVPFSQRPKSVLLPRPVVSTSHDENVLSKVTQVFLAIQSQDGTGLQPLLSQRVLPDVIAALAELAFSPASSDGTRSQYLPIFNNITSLTPTSRMLPILTTFLQQPLPLWLKPILSRELSTIPLRPQGVRHIIEFLSLSYLSKNSQVPQDASGSQSQIPIPLEAITQASRLLVLPPIGTGQDQWLQELAPQLWSLIDGNDGRELSRAAGQIVAGGILSKKSTGAPGTSGWSIFAEPLLESINPKSPEKSTARAVDQRTVVEEPILKTALNRLAVIASSYSHAGLLRRLIGPILLPLWALLNYSKTSSTVDKAWTSLPRSILQRYMQIACDAKQVDDITINLFWDGGDRWVFGPGSQGGVEIRNRVEEKGGATNMNNIFARLENLDSKVQLLVSLLSDSKVSDDTAGSIFLQTSQRWLSVNQPKKNALLEDDEDPLAALIDAKLSQALAIRFSEQFARKPQHIIGLMSQLLQNFVNEHQHKVKKQAKANEPNRARLHDIISQPDTGMNTEETNDENIASFAISILNTLVSSTDFSQTPETRTTLAATIPPLVYLSQPQPTLPIASVLSNSANVLLHVLQPSPASAKYDNTDPLTEHRATLRTVMADLTSPDPPNRTWALTTLGNLMRDPAAFSILDVPSLTHMLLSASLADPESYVHTAAIPVILNLAILAPNPVLGILIDAFVDIDERSLRLSRGKQTDEKARELQEALDFRLRVGEVLSKLVIDDEFWRDTTMRHGSVKRITEACLSLASRRGQRKQTLDARTQLQLAERQTQEEGEEAWGGPIPNLLDPEGEDPQDQADRDALLKIVQGWEDTGVEEDLRIRASAMSILSSVMEYRLGLLKQVSVNAALQMVILILTVETSEVKAILRRAAVLVVMGLLRGLDAALDDDGRENVVLGLKQEEEVERVMKWVRDEDGDEIVRDHASSVVEGLETLRMRKLYLIRDDGLRMRPDLGLDGRLRGLNVTPDVSERTERPRKMVIEEVE